MSLAKQGKGNKETPTFKDVGGNQEESTEEVKEQTPEEENSIDSIVDTIVHAPKEKPKEQVSIYLDEDVYKAFKKFGSRYGKGSKSTLVNNFLKKALSEYIK